MCELLFLLLPFYAVNLCTNQAENLNVMCCELQIFVVFTCVL